MSLIFIFFFGWGYFMEFAFVVFAKCDPFPSQIWILHPEAFLMWEILPSAGGLTNTHSSLDEIMRIMK